MATPQQINDLVGLYVAYFDRAPDPEGLQFWITQLDNGRDFNTISQDFAMSAEAREIYPFLATPDLVANSPEAFIGSIYQNLFGRAPDQEGLDFWTLAINSGAVAPGDMVEAIMLGAQDTLVNGELIQDKTIVANKIECALDWTTQVSQIEGFVFDGEAYDAAGAAIDGVGADQASVDAAKLVTAQYINEFAIVTDFQLKQATAEVVVSVGSSSTETVMVDTLMWGNPETGEGIPISEFFGEGGYFSLIAAQAFAGVDQIDTDEDAFSIIDFSAVESIDLIPTAAGDGSVSASGGIVQFNYTDGSADDIALGGRYYDLLTELMFVDAGDPGSDNNTRFFTDTSPAQLPVYVTADGGTTTVASEGVGEPIGYVDATLVTPGEPNIETIDVPLILTTTVNNDSTTFFGFTSADNDIIVAPTLDLLHAATIDAGLGQNTLQVDAKGHFAQPRALLNIQTIEVQNLPNIYTENDNSSSYPEVLLGSVGSSDSILDLSRATALENLVVTEGSYDYIQASNNSAGDLALIGMRNDATLTLSGGFINDVYVSTTGGYPADGFTVALNNVLAHNNGSANLYIADNGAKLNLISEGGGSNLNGIYGYNDSRVTDIVISGEGRLFIEDGLESLMEDQTPLTIDASANLGGVDLNIEGGEFITFTGSKGDDRFSVEAEDESGTSQGPDFGSDEAVVITNTAGNNWYDVESKELTLTDADGDITVKAETGQSIINLGEGDNTVIVETTELELALGGGDNHVEVSLQSDNFGYLVGDEHDKEANIVAGDGENTIRVEVQTTSSDVAEVNVTAGNGGNEIEVTQSGLATTATQTVINVTTGTGSDTILAEGSEITITSGGGNDDITIVGTDNDYASDTVDTEGAGGNDGSTGSNSPAVGGNVVTANPFDDGVTLNIDTGADAATITLGVEGEASSGIASSNVVAKDGSVITGTDITLNVNTYANLIAADISGVTSVVLDDDAGNRADSAQANDLYNGERAQLTVTMDQFLAIGADNMSVEGALFNTQGFVKIIVTESTSLTDLGVDDLPRNIDLYLEIADGVTVTMTAEQLHTRIARDGVTTTDDGNTDLLGGSVVITGGGQDFDPFNSNDTVQTNIGGNIVYFGGSLSTADFGLGFNVTVQSVLGGYDRPAPAAPDVVFTIDSDLTPTVGDVDSFHTNIEIVGDNDITFDGVLEFGLLQGNSSSLFTIDFSELVGTATGLTIGNFETVEQVLGNGVPGTEVFVQISGDDDDGGSGDIGFDDDDTGSDDADDRALISSGVSQYTVTVIEGPSGAGAPGNTATIRLCDLTQDLEVLAFRGNYNDQLIILDAAWDLTFELQGGSTAKADGPTDTANVGILDARFEWDGAPAVVNIVHSVAGDTRPIHVEGIELVNADSLEVNAEGPATEIDNLDIPGVDALDLNADGDLEISDPIIVEGPIDIDASGVVGSFTGILSGVEAGDADFTFTGGVSEDTLTLINIDDDEAEGVTIDGGAGGVALIIAPGVDGDANEVDLDESTLTNINSVTLGNNSELSISIPDADAIGPDNFLIANGDSAVLNLSELGEDPFAIADYADGITINVVSLADLPEITLNAATDLTGITELMVPEGTILNLTAEQFQQLTGDGIISGEDGNTNFTVNITDWTQASVDQNDPDGDSGTATVAGENFDLSGITTENLTITMAEDISIDAGDNLGGADVTMSDGFTITVEEITVIDGINFSGGVDTTINITDDTFDVPNQGSGVEGIDASGFDVDLVRITNVLAANRNVDALLDGIPERATKEIYNTLNFVDGVTQNVVIFEGTTVPGGIGFIPLDEAIELRIFNLSMEGGTEIDGTLRLFQSADELGNLQNDLQEVNISSTNPTAVNALTGDTGNVIDGDINPFPGPATFAENDLLNVNITGDADFTLTGSIRFSSVVGNDQIGANDDDDATATLTVNSTANTVIGEIDTSDADVTSVEITNAGTGGLTVGINANNIDADDAITFTGSATGYDKISVQGDVDLSDDTLTDIDEIEFDSDATNPTTITLTQAQLDAVGVANLTTTEDDDFENGNAVLNLVEFGLTPFDATGLDADITMGSVTLAAGDIVLDPATNLTGVDAILVPEGGSITLTAAQFQQLDGNGTIVSVDGVDPGTTAGPITINITDLTQADIDGGSFVLSDVDSGTDGVPMPDTGYGAVNLSLAESVELSDDDDLATGNDGEVDVTLTDGQDLGLENSNQADGLNVVGTGTTDVFFRFDALEAGDADGVLDMSGYDVSNVHALNFFVGGTNIEELLNQLSEDVTLVIYQDPAELSILSSVSRVVIVNEGVTVAGGLAFNDLEDGTEVIALNLTLSGGSALGQDMGLGLDLSTVVPPLNTAPANFQLLTINSVGDGTTENLVSGGTTNIIRGDIIATPPSAATTNPTAPDGNGTPTENNLLDIIINADQALELTGSVRFNKVGDDAVGGGDDEAGNVTVNGTADVTINDLSTADNDVDALNVTNAGTGNLTVGISSTNTVQVDDVITLTGSATGIDTIVVTGGRDFSGDTIGADWDVIELNNGTAEDAAVAVTLTQAQFDGVDLTTTSGEDDAGDNTATLNLVEFGAAPFDATSIDPDIDMGTITLAAGDITLDPTTDLTGVDEIIIPEGGSLTLTAAQFQQLEGAGTITGVDSDGNPTTDITVNITDLMQADVDIDLDEDGDTDDAGETLDLSDVAADALNLAIVEDIVLDDDAELNNAAVTMPDGTTLSLANAGQADGLDVTGGADTTVVYQFASTAGTATPGSIDASGYDITTLKALAVFVGGTNAEVLIDDLISSIELRLFADSEDLGFLNQTDRIVFVEADVTVPGDGGANALIFNDIDPEDEVRSLTLTLDGGVTLEGDITVPTMTNKDPGAVQTFFQTMTIVSQGDNPNVIEGGLETFTPAGQPNDTLQNDLLNIVIIADQDLSVGVTEVDTDTGQTYFNGQDETSTQTASLSVSGPGNVQFKSLNVEEEFGGESITALTVTNEGPGVLTVVGGRDAVGTTAQFTNEAIELSDTVTTLTFSGAGDIVLDTDDLPGSNGIEGDGLTTLDASGHTGALTLSVIEDVSDEEFTLTAGTGVTTATLGDAVGTGGPLALDSTGPDSDDPSDDLPGWTFDFSGAAAGSVLTVANIEITPAVGSANTDQSSLSFDMGADAVLKIEQDLDLTNTDFSFTGTQAIELLDGVTLTLTAAQADGLTIIRCDDGDDGTDPAVVNIIELGTDPVDLSGIDAEIAGAVRLDRDLDNDGTNEDDVTLDPATDLGEFTLELLVLGNGDNNLSGQTVRFTAEEQAALDIDVVFDPTEPGTVDPAADGNNTNSSNVAFLFESITGQVDTSQYDEEIGRVWVSAALVNSVGGDIEDIFTTLPNSIVRVDFNTVADLDILLASAPIDRIIELTSFTDIVGITEVDDDINPEEHIRSLDIRMGGEVTVGDIIIGDVVAAADTDPLTPEFETLNFDSRRALSDSHVLSTEDYVNDNDGDPETGESVQPDAVNTVGDIEVGGTNLGIDLIDVTINTFDDSEPLVGVPGTPGPSNNTDGGAGSDFVFGTLTFDSEGDDTTTGDDEGEGELTVTGENDVTGKAIDASDAEITSVFVDTVDHTGTLTFTGGSPAFFGGVGTEQLIIDNDSATDGVVNFGGTITFDDMTTTDVDEFSIDFTEQSPGVPFAGIAGETLSLIDTDDHGGTVNLGVIAQIDGDGAVTDGTSTPTTLGGLLPAADAEGFHLDNSDGAAGVGAVYACLGEADVNGTLVSPELTATGEWVFNGGTTPGTQTIFLDVKDVTLNAGGKIALIGTEVTISGDIDITDVAIADLTIVNSTLSVAAGGTLTMTVEQVTGLGLLGVDITGEGTVVVTGESDDTDSFASNGFDPTMPGTDTDFANLQTATVDLSAVTLAATDGSEFVEITVDGAIGDDGVTAVTQTVIGTAENDLVVVNADDMDTETLDVILQLGDDDGALGDPANPDPEFVPGDGGDPLQTTGDIIQIVNDGEVQIEVDAGFDAAVPLTDTTTVQVAAGAEFVGQATSFTATEDTSNDGTATIVASGLNGPDNNALIDMTLATGANGFTIIGADEVNNAANRHSDTLIGSDNDDVLIDGAASSANGELKEDTFTGNGGADSFQFAFETTTPATLVDVENNPALDEEIITAVAGTDVGTEFIVIDYAIGNTLGSLTVNDTNYNTMFSVATGIDFSDPIDLANKIAEMLDAVAGLTAVSDGVDTVTLTGDDGARINVTTFTPGGGAGASTTADAGTDTAQDNTITITGSGSSGELYSLTVMLSDGTDIEATFLATGGESATDIAAGLIADFNAASGGAITASAGGAGEINLQDNDADDGGFGVTVLGATTSVGSGGISSLLTGAETNLQDADADVITDFMSADGDQITFGLAAGDGTIGGNYDEAAYEDTFVAAQAAADLAFAANAGLVYYLTGTNDLGDGGAILPGDDGGATGLLFLNVDGDTDADAVISLLGVDSTNFDGTDIV